MDFFSSLVHSMDANGENRQTYNFSKYERAIRSNKYKMHYTIDKWIEIAYKVMLKTKSEFFLKAA